MKDMHDLEVYAPIKGYNGYLITSHGRILSLKGNKMRELKQSKNRDGYIQVTLYKNGKVHTKKVHRLVAQTFILNSENKSDVNHIDENKANNHVSNLEWVTHKENMNHGTCIERIANSNRGKKHTEEAKRKLSEYRRGKYIGDKSPCAKTVIGFKIVGCGIKYYKFIDECKKDGFDTSNISKCCKGKRKSHKGYTWYYTDDFFNRKDDNQ